MQCLGIYAAVFHKGYGDRGGHIIGYTRSRKPIYGSAHSSNASVHKDGLYSFPVVRGISATKAHPSFDANDHLDAADAHDNEAVRARNREHREGSHLMSSAHVMAYMYHRSSAKKKPSP